MAKSDIMIVDDNPANLRLLEDMLHQRNHEVRSFPLGRLALTAAAKAPPDLILLDITMPEMNGYEVCERLKSTETLKDVPVIFLSALSEIQDKVKAFQAGAVDYISKPFQFEEVHARVETHLKLHLLQQELKRQNEHLEEIVAARTRELAEANGRLIILDRSKNEFLNLVSHEFRTPLHGLLGVGEIILEEMPSTDENNELREAFEQSRRRILSILDDALLLTQIDVSADRFRSVPVSLSATLRHAIENTTDFAASHRVVVGNLPMGVGLVTGDEGLLLRAMSALLETAVRFSGEGETIAFEYEAPRDLVVLAIETRGKIIPDSELPKFFDVFSVAETSTPGKHLGLGPAVAFRILSLFRASVTVSNRETSGIRLTISMRSA